MKKDSVGIVYHFFAHYREPIIHELLNSKEYNFWFVGDKSDPLKKGIRAANILDHNRFVYARSHFWGRYLFQQGVLKFALRKDINTIIYLGDAQFISTWVSAVLARITGKKVYFWSHGWIHSDPWVKNVIRNSFYRLANGGLMLYGERAKRIGIQKGFNPDRIYVIYNSLNYEQCKKIRDSITPAEQKSVRQEYFSDPTLPTIICTSRLVKERSLALLFEALAILKSRGYYVNTIIVGEGPEKNALIKMASELELPAKFMGECYDEKILALLFMAANVTVVPSYIGLTAIHSLGYGTPVITNDNPELHGPEWEVIQPGVNGDYYRYGDITDLAEKIYTWTQLDSVQESNIHARCINIIEQHYTPSTQRAAIEFALSGKPASLEFS